MSFPSDATASLKIWDHECDPPDVEGLLLWQSYARKGSSLSVPNYLEEHADRLKKKYLGFVHDLGETRINGKRILDHLDQGKNFSHWWMNQITEKSPFKSPQIFTCLRLLALEEILLEKKPRELTLHGSDSCLAQVLRRLCLNLDINFVWQSGPRPRQKWSLRAVFRSLPHPVRGLLGFVRYVQPRWANRKLKKPKWFSGNDVVFLCSYFIHLDTDSCSQGRFHSRHWGALTQVFRESGYRTNWVQHFLFSSAVPDIKTGVEWLGLFNLDPHNQGCHVFLETYLSWGILLRAIQDWLWLNVVALRLRKIKSYFYPRGSAVWLWPVLKSEWFTSLRGQVAMNNCLWVRLFDSVLKEMPVQKSGYYLCENQGWERAFIHAWRRHGHGELVGVVHATVPYWHLYYFEDPRVFTSKQNCGMPLPDRWAINGPVAYESFAASGYPVERLVKVEALRYLNLSKKITARRHRNARRKKILVLGDMIPLAMHNLIEILRATIKMSPSDYEFTLKSHPGYQVNLADYPGVEFRETSEALDKIIDQYDAAIAANSTSAALDAYMAGLTVVIILDRGTLNLSPLRGHVGAIFVSTPEELAVALRTNANPSDTQGDQSEFFYLDSELPRWKQLLRIDSLASAGHEERRCRGTAR
jgi:surface carbohydrate biosynthesis protein (TIGR04326 family)